MKSASFATKKDQFLVGNGILDFGRSPMFKVIHCTCFPPLKQQTKDNEGLLVNTNDHSLVHFAKSLQMILKKHAFPKISF